MRYKFEMADLGNEDFHNELTSRTQHRGSYTQFVDLTSFLPRDLVPACQKDLFIKDSFSFEDAVLTVKWFASVFFDSVYISGFTPCGKSTSTGRQRQWRHRNILLFKDFVRTFCVDKGKLQIEKFRTLRGNLDREGCHFEKFWENSELGPDRIANLQTDEWDKVDVDLYRDNLFRIVHQSGIRSAKHKKELRYIWHSVEQGYAWGYSHKIVNTLSDASAKTHMTDDELRSFLEPHLDKNLSVISQCPELRGRNIVFIYRDSYISFSGCIKCDHNRKAPTLAHPDEDQLCRAKGLPPLGKSLPVMRRNEFTRRKGNLIRERDKNLCVAAETNKNPCKGSICLGHVVSAWNTSHILTEYDGLCLCEFHNGHMGNKRLLDSYPKLKSWAIANQINVSGRNLDLIDWPPEAV